MGQYELYTILALTLVFLVTTFMLLQFMIQFRGLRYNEEKNRMELEMMRKYLEEKVYQSTDRLTSDAKRWGQVNHLLLEVVEKMEKDDKYFNKEVNKIVNDKITNKNYYSANRFLHSSGIDINDIIVDPRKVFILTPFHQMFEKTYDLIANICRKVGLKCSRGDEDFIRGGVLSHILEELLSSGLIIANLDGRNPNVFYELGIAHALNKDVILISSNIEEVPFDLKSHRLILWKTPENLERELNLALTRLLIDS